MCEYEYEEEIEVMKEWFFEHYEDPAENTPHDSEEGYIYLWGGPYDAFDVLSNEFGGIYSDEAIEELSDELTNGSYEWARIPDEEDYDHGYIEDYDQNKFDELISNILTLERMISMVKEPSLAGMFHNMLFVNAITVLETFFSDFFISTIYGKKNFQLAFLEKCELKTTKTIKLYDFYEKYEFVDDYLKECLRKDVVWHNLPKVKTIYEKTFSISFPKIGRLCSAVKLRHDIVHRNGKKMDGEPVKISKEYILEILDEIKTVSEKVFKDVNDKVGG